MIHILSEAVEARVVDASVISRGFFLEIACALFSLGPPGGANRTLVAV